LHNLKSYTAYNAALQPFYTLPNLPSSPNRPVVLGLYLLALLSGGQLTEFHTLLERLGPGEMEDSFVKLPVDLYVWFLCLGLVADDQGTVADGGRVQQGVSREGTGATGRVRLLTGEVDGDCSVSSWDLRCVYAVQKLTFIEHR
jgi:hypothetical protein